MKTKSVSLRCDCKAESLVFTRYDYSDSNFETDYEINVEDSYCGGDYMGIKGRFKRAWHAFFAKPVYYSGIYTDNKNDVKKWLEDCLAIINEDDVVTHKRVKHSDCDGCFYQDCCTYFDTEYAGLDDNDRFVQCCVGCPCGDGCECNKHNGCSNYDNTASLG